MRSARLLYLYEWTTGFDGQGLHSLRPRCHALLVVACSAKRLGPRTPILLMVRRVVAIDRYTFPVEQASANPGICGLQRRRLVSRGNRGF